MLNLTKGNYSIYQIRYLAISHIVEDTKGNPGIRGHFYATNLRFVWHGANDRDINLSIG